MEKQIVGTEQALSKGPRNMEHEGKTGSPTKQITGDQAPIATAPSANLHNENIREGTREIVGDKANCSSTAYKSFESMDTPMSERVQVKK